MEVVRVETGGGCDVIAFPLTSSGPAYVHPLPDALVTPPNDWRISCKRLACLCTTLCSAARHRRVAAIGAQLGRACQLHARVRLRALDDPDRLPARASPAPSAGLWPTQIPLGLRLASLVP
jgi:hypothetical protein